MGDGLVFLILSIIIILNFSLIVGFQYPKARRDESVVDNYFGTNVSDPYRWLENGHSNETKEFLSSQTLLIKKYLESNRHRSHILVQFEYLYNHAKYGIPFKVGSKYYMTGMSHMENQDTLYSMDSFDSYNMKPFLDANRMDSEGRVWVDWTSFSDDGRYCAYDVWVNGADWSTIRIRDSHTSQDLPDVLRKVKFSIVAWTSDNLGFFYSQYDEFNGTLDGLDYGTVKNQKLFYHRLNTSQSEDIKITSFPGHPHRFIMELYVDSSGQYLHILPRERSEMVWSFAKLELPVTKALQFTEIVKEPENIYEYITADEHNAYALTDKDASNKRVVKISLDNGKGFKWTDIIAENKTKIIKSVMPFNKEYLVVVYMKDVIDSVVIHNITDGKVVRELTMPIIGTVNGLGANGSKILIKMTSFVTPGIIYAFDFNNLSLKPQVYRESKLLIDLQQLVFKQVFFPSKDGSVKVPMFLLHKKGLVLDGSNPTLLYGYGGFGNIAQPNYYPLGLFFANNLNGVYALANTRGNGEYGEHWHLSGSRMNKQNAFDDFASAAEYLIKNNYTRRDRLAIHGESVGGKLVGVSSNQRPDLFGCSIAAAGAHDSIRYPLYTTGYSQVAEYGDPQTNATEFNYIYKYSSLHNVPVNATEYPATLLMTGDHDDRVVPAHAYKFGAQLQHSLGTKLPNTPIMIRVDPNTGHEGKSVTKSILYDTDIVVFVLNSLGIDYPKNQTTSEVPIE